MLKFLIILLIVIYAWSILDKIIKLSKITSCINTLLDFLQSTTPSSHRTLVGDNYKGKLGAVLAKYPNICEFTTIYSDSLQYGASDYKNYTSSVNLYNELIMQRNFLRKAFFDCLNPISAVKILISLPSSVVRLFGFKVKPASIKFLNLVGWIITYFLGMYQEEIKALISSLLKLH